MRKELSELERAILDTVRYFDIFRMPVTATQVWWSLIHTPQAPHAIHPTLASVQATLRNSLALAERIETKWGYYFLVGKSALVTQRLLRHNAAQDKWKVLKRSARLLAFVPFVRGLAGSGSLALDNTKNESDLDLLVISHPRRIWTTRLGLLIVSQLLGRRRKYWDTSAPNKLCLNHYVAKNHLLLPKELHNIYTAMLYRHLVPVYGLRTVRQFQNVNEKWMHAHISQPPYPVLVHYNSVSLSRIVRRIKRALENLLLEPIGDGFERFAETLQRRVIAHHGEGRQGRIMLSEQELAFHPDTKVPAILAAFEREA